MATGDYDIILNADIQFKEENLINNLKASVDTIFTAGLTSVFESMGKTLAKSFADALEDDKASTDKIGKAIMDGIARQYAQGKQPAMGVPGAWGAAPRATDMGAVLPGAPAGSQRYGSTSDMQDWVAGQNLTEAQIGQVAMSKMPFAGGGPISSLLRTSPVQKYVGGLFKGRAMKQLEQGQRWTAPGMEKSIDVSEYVDPTTGKAPNASYWEPGMKEGVSFTDVAGEGGAVTEGIMSQAAKGVGGVKGLGAAMEGEAATAGAGAAAGVATGVGIAAVVAKKVGDVVTQQMAATWRLQGQMLGGPGASANAAMSAQLLSMIGMTKTADVISQLSQSDLTIKEMNASVEQATTATYGFGMSTQSATGYLKYQYEILGNSTTEATDQLNKMAGQAAAAGMSVEQFSQMAMGASKGAEAAGYGRAAVAAGTVAAGSIRQNIPGLTDTNVILGQQPQTPLAWRAAETRLGVPLSQMGPSMMGGKEGEGGQLAWMIGEAKYAHRMFGGNREMAAQYLQSRFPGLNMEQAGDFYDKYGAMSTSSAIAKAKSDQRKEAMYAARAGEAAKRTQRGYGIFGAVLKFIPGMGEAGKAVESYGAAQATEQYQQIMKPVTGKHAVYGTAAPFSGTGATTGLTTTPTSEGGLIATQGGLTVEIKPSKEFDAAVYDANESQGNIYNQSKGGL